MILNGAPRSGKSSIAAAIQETLDGVWVNLGVDAVIAMTPERLRPGIGLRPGGERPDLEPLIPVMFAALYDSMAAHARHGLGVVVDVGHHDRYTRPLGTLAIAAERLAGLPSLLVGVRCPLDEIMRRRGRAGEPPPAPVRRWQEAVHDPGVYDLEVDTSAASPEECAAAIHRRIHAGPAPTALARATRH